VQASVKDREERLCGRLCRLVPDAPRRAQMALSGDANGRDGAVWTARYSSRQLIGAFAFAKEADRFPRSGRGRHRRFRESHQYCDGERQGIELIPVPEDK